MESIREIYRIGHGPSSSHTMGPRKASEVFLLKCKDAYKYVITLYGSLAATGKGHLTGVTIEEIFRNKRFEIIWKPEIFLPRHPNAIKFEAFDENESLIQSWTAYSVGGGAIVDDETYKETREVYPVYTMDEILAWCDNNGKQIWEFVEEYEGSEIWDFLSEVWSIMKQSIRRGLEAEGNLPGSLNLARKASSYSTKAKDMSGPIKRRSILYSLALAVSEENASGGKIVTAPTCGASGVLPAVARYYEIIYKAKNKKILKALATAGLIGNLVKTNASISGAEVGCQGEVGTACAMASAAATQLSGGSIYQIEYSAEMGIEHHLGLTCDPVDGLVQIPCIERNAFGAARALNHNTYAMLSDGRHRISFDEVVEVMKRTGQDLPSFYRETSLGGLAYFHTLRGKNKLKL